MAPFFMRSYKARQYINLQEVFYMKTKQTILNVFEAVAAPVAGIVAGGSLTDAFFGKEAYDFDVFVPAANETKLLGQFIKGDVVFNQKRAGFKAENSPIVRVYETTVDGAPVDVVILNIDDVVDYVHSTFDGNIKKAWYDGEFHAASSFWAGVERNEYIIDVEDGRAVHYIRAVIACEKYGLELTINESSLTAYKKLEWMFNQDVYAVGDKYLEKYNELRKAYFDKLEQLAHEQESLESVDYIGEFEEDEKVGETESMRDMIYQDIKKEFMSGY